VATETDWAAERTALLGKRISELGLRLQGTPIERLTEQLYDELRARGLAYLPPVYLSDEWGCPEATPLIAVPFYLADERLRRIEAERAAGVESEADSMRYLRHEAGHAYNYAYRLYDRPEWRRIFGPYSRPYSDRYHADPFSRNYVRHILGWYAQKHPDEDFAETFAVWLTPGFDWRERYANWPALAKLEYVDQVMKEIGAEPPVVQVELNEDHVPVEAMHYTVEQYYRELEEKLPVDDERFFDGDLLTIFTAEDSDGKDAADEFLLAHRQEIVARISYWSGESPGIVGAFVNFLIVRATGLHLYLREKVATTLIELTAFGTAVMMNYRYNDTMGRTPQESI
jgi:hypothetical protein